MLLQSLAQLAQESLSAPKSWGFLRLRLRISTAGWKSLGFPRGDLKVQISIASDGDLIPRIPSENCSLSADVPCAQRKIDSAEEFGGYLGLAASSRPPPVTALVGLAVESILSMYLLFDPPIGVGHHVERCPQVRVQERFCL